MARKKFTPPKDYLEKLKKAQPPEAPPGGLLPLDLSHLVFEAPDHTKAVPNYKPDKNYVELDVSQVFSKQYVAASKLARIGQLTSELAKRRLETLRLYEPLPVQQMFHACNATYRLLRGSNRSGKTLAAAVEVSRMVTCQDPFDKYPKDGGTLFAVGKDEKHVGKVLYEKLFKNKSMMIIRDLATRRWRAYRPWTVDDQGRESEARWAPPLIPERFVREIAWKDKKLNVPAAIRLTTGWDIHFFSSLGKPPQGSPIDAFWLDEEIVDPSWLPEMQARIVDRNGRGIWSCTPQAGTEQLYDLHEKAERERHVPENKRRHREFVVLIRDNKFQSEEQVKNFAADMSDEERRVRVDGEYAILSYRVYPNFNAILHAYPNEEIPPHWTRYAYVDPGHRTCAVLFVAVPPPEEGDFVVVYSELYLQEVNAHMFGEAMKHATSGQEFQAFMIDANMALHTEVGIGKNVLMQYTEALQKNGVKSVSTGSGFLLGNDDVQAGVLAVQGMLVIRKEGAARLRVIIERCPNFLHEIRHYHRAKVAGVVQQKPDNRKDNHLMDCLRYMALHEPKYVKRVKKETPKGSLNDFRLKLQRRKERNEDEGVINLGPGGRFY